VAGPELKRLGRYTIESTLGQGAMGVVYGATDSTLHRKVAIKTILKSALDPETARQYSLRFMREAQAVARLNHPNIVQVHDFGEEGDIAYIVMEFIKGRELQDFFDDDQRFELKEVVRIMAELCDALQFAHEAGIIHRDIKPANVMIDAQGRVKLADFGVARITDADRTLTERTQAGTMIGTPAYMSPEQISGGQIDHRSDIFSAGIILYQLLSGERAFVGEGAWTIAKKIMQDHPPPPSTINSRVAPIFDRVANKALAKNAKDRYQNARDLASALRLSLEGKAREEEGGKTPAAAPAEAPKKAAPQVVPTNPGTQEVELEFWRAIKDGNDPEDFDLYVQQFPSGIYADLARRKIAKLRGTSVEEDTQKAAVLEKKALEEAARREADARAKLAEEKARLEAELARKEAEMRRREAEGEARRQAEAKARAEEVARAKQQAEALVAKQAADERARRAAEENARKAAEARAKYEAAERAKREADLAKREAELTQRMASAPGKRSLLVPAIVAAAVVAALGAGLFAWKRSDSSADAKRMEELVAQLDQYKQREAELKQSREQGARLDQEAAQARQREAEMQKQAEAMRQREEEAKKAGDLAKQRELAALAAQREADAKKQAELTRQREAEAKKQAELTRQREAEAKKQAEAAKRQQAELARLEAEKRKQAESSGAADKAAKAKAAAEKAAAEKAAAEKATEAARKAAAQKQADAERLAKLEADRQAQAAAAERAAGERIAAEKAAAEKAAAEKAAAEKAAAEKAKLASAASASAGSADALYSQAQALENEKKFPEAVRMYVQAARAGSGQAAKKLGDLYGKGAPGVTIDSTESIKWYNFARLRGVDVGR
jgi:tRNA A-37 threonylcarbamoyl transferase component Bud32